MAGQDESRRRHPQGGGKRATEPTLARSAAWSAATAATIALVVCFAPLAEAQPRIVPIGETGTPYAEMELGRPGGTLRLACLEGPVTWNDMIAYDPSTSRFTNLMFRGLVSVDPLTGELFGDLAASWEVSEDGLTVTFHLREGVWWSDGMPFTAHDVLFTYNDLILDEDVDAAYRQRLYLPDDTFPMCERIDDHTVRFILSTVFRPILNSLTFNIMPKHKLAQYVRKLNPNVPAKTFNEAWGLSTDPDDLCVIGPYRLEELYPRTHSRDGIHMVVMVRNPKYYAYDPNGVQLPYFERVEYRIVTNEDFALLKFRNGEIDCLGMRPTDVPILLPESDAKGWTLVATEMPTCEMIWFYVNQVSLRARMEKSGNSIAFPSSAEPWRSAPTKSRWSRRGTAILARRCGVRCRWLRCSTAAVSTTRDRLTHASRSRCSPRPHMTRRLQSGFWTSSALSIETMTAGGTCRVAKHSRSCFSRAKTVSGSTAPWSCRTTFGPSTSTAIFNTTTSPCYGTGCATLLWMLFSSD